MSSNLPDSKGRSSALLALLIGLVGPPVAFTRDLDRTLTLACTHTHDLGLDPVLDRALDGYIRDLLRREREAERLPAYEGILLVKERQ